MNLTLSLCCSKCISQMEYGFDLIAIMHIDHRMGQIILLEPSCKSLFIVLQFTLNRVVKSHWVRICLHKNIEYNAMKCQFYFIVSAYSFSSSTVTVKPRHCVTVSAYFRVYRICWEHETHSGHYLHHVALLAIFLLV